MAMGDPDILAVARSLMAWYGAGAKQRAWLRAANLLEAGDTEGSRRWMEVTKYIDSLQRHGDEPRN
jgi:hypothetical protein